MTKQQAKKEKKKIYDKQYLILNREKINKKSRTWKQRNPQKVFEQGQRYRAKYGRILTERTKLWRASNPEKKQRYDFLSRTSSCGIDISFEDYKILIDKQKGFCALCGNKETYVYGTGKIKQLALDHNHKTRKPRELLCQKCNTGIGCLKEDIELLRKAIKYLKKHQ